MGQSACSHHRSDDATPLLCLDMGQRGAPLRGPLAIWSDPETQWLAKPTGKRGRQSVFTDAAIQICLTLKALFGLPQRQTTEMAASLLDLTGLDWPVRD